MPGADNRTEVLSFANSVCRLAQWHGVLRMITDIYGQVGGYAMCPVPTTKQCFLNNSILSIPRTSDAVTSLGRQQNRETLLPKSLNTSQNFPKTPMSNTCSSLGTAYAAACCACAWRRTTNPLRIQNRRIHPAG